MIKDNDDRTMTCCLAEKAAFLERWTEDVLIDGNGLVYSSINNQTNAPWQDKDIKVEDDYPTTFNYPIASILNYEDTGIDTGVYLAALSFRYSVTPKPEVMTKARRTFESILYVYEIGCQKEEGYWPKPYGGKYSEETSTDQYLYVMKGMMAYLDIAEEDHVQAIREMIPRMVDFWIKRKYSRTYFNHVNMLWPLGRFPCFLAMAHKVSGDSKYAKEFERLNEQEKVYLEPADSQLRERMNNLQCLTDYEKKHNKGFLLLFADCGAVMGITELDECLRYSDKYREHWLQTMAWSWREASLTLTTDGLCRNAFFYEPSTGKTCNAEPGFVRDADPLTWDFERWAGNILVPRSTTIARVGIYVAKWLPQEGSANITRQILKNISTNNMMQYIDPDGKQILTKHKFVCNQVAGYAPTNWLCAYWQGRYEGVIDSDE